MQYSQLCVLLVVQEYVRGLCDPELQKEERYPVDMHCIFAGARGLFLDRLIRDTSAEVLVQEPGCLRLLGRAEPVVMAQSRVQQFVALFQVRVLLSDVVSFCSSYVTPGGVIYIVES